MDALEVVKRHLQPVEGIDVVPVLKAVLEQLEATDDETERERIWLSDPCWSLVSADVEIRVPILDLPVFRGREGVMDFWRHWFDTWDAYVFEAVRHRDLGAGAILTEIRIRARGRGGVPVETNAFEVRRVRDGLLVSLEVFGSERAAVRAVAQ